MLLSIADYRELWRQSKLGSSYDICEAFHNNYTLSPPFSTSYIKPSHWWYTQMFVRSKWLKIKLFSSNSSGTRRSRHRIGRINLVNREIFQPAIPNRRGTINSNPISTGYTFRRWNCISLKRLLEYPGSTMTWR